MNIRDNLPTLFVVLIVAFSFIMVFNHANAEEKTYTPQQTIEAFASVPGKVGNHLKNEWEDIKIYQANSWAEMKIKFNGLKAKFIKD